jgi:Ca2+-binding RTX toxin-like protein
MIRRRLPAGLIVAAAVGLAVASASTALTAGATVDPGRLGLTSQATGPDQLKPAACAPNTLTNLVTGSVTVTGTSANDFLIATGLLNTVLGLDGDDCLLGGGGVDTLNGGPGFDVCIGGPLLDVFLACEVQIQ